MLSQTQCTCCGFFFFFFFVTNNKKKTFWHPGATKPPGVRRVVPFHGGKNSPPAHGILDMTAVLELKNKWTREMMTKTRLFFFYCGDGGNGEGGKKIL